MFAIGLYSSLCNLSIYTLIGFIICIVCDSSFEIEMHNYFLNINLL